MRGRHSTEAGVTTATLLVYIILYESSYVGRDMCRAAYHVNTCPVRSSLSIDCHCHLILSFRSLTFLYLVCYLHDMIYHIYLNG